MLQVELYLGLAALLLVQAGKFGAPGHDMEHPVDGRALAGNRSLSDRGLQLIETSRGRCQCTWPVSKPATRSSETQFLKGAQGFLAHFHDRTSVRGLAVSRTS